MSSPFGIPAGLRILVVEDEALVAEEIRHRLGALNVDVVAHADTGEGAVRLARELRPDLVLMDIRLKGDMDGIDAAFEIARDDMPVVYLTAHSDEATLDRAAGVGPFGYVLKPFHESDLRVAIAAAVGRAAAERFLKDRDSLYAATLASIADGVIATDVTGRVLFLNPVAEALLGWSLAEAGEMQVDSVLVLVGEESGEPVANLVRTALETRQAVRPTPGVALVARGGGSIPVALSAAPVMTQRDRLAGAVVIFHDLREQRRAEQDLREIREALEQAQRIEAIGRLAGGVAHDFNNLVMIIVNCCDLLLDHGLAEEPAQLVSEVRAAGERAGALTSQLLAFGRRQLMTPRALDLNALVIQLERILRRLLGENVRLELRLQSTPTGVLADPTQVEQVLMNLALNARDAMPGGGVLTISTESFEPSEVEVLTTGPLPVGRYVRLEVSDTGVGIDPEIRPRLFEPFFTTKELGRGSGLGLATVAGIVEQSGGQVNVGRSESGGTVFSVYLPAAEVVALTVAAPVKATTALRTILVVEDEAPLRNITVRALRGLGHAVVEAADGAAALATSRAYSGRIDLLLTDAIMPGMSGREVAEKLTSERPEMAVLIMSGYTDDVLLQHDVSHGDYAFLQKPFTVKTLELKVRELLALGETAKGGR